MQEAYKEQEFLVGINRLIRIKGQKVRTFQGREYREWNREKENEMTERGKKRMGGQESRMKRRREGGTGKLFWRPSLNGISLKKSIHQCLFLSGGKCSDTIPTFAVSRPLGHGDRV